MIFTDRQLDEMEARQLGVTSISQDDIVEVRKMFVERRQLIEEVRRMYALMDQVARLSYAAFHEET